MFHQLLLPPPVQVTLPQEMGPRYNHTATVFGSGPNFRMVVMFGGHRRRSVFVVDPIAETTLLHLGECAVWNITCYTSRNIPFGKEGCPVLPRLVPGQLGTSLDTWDTPVSHTQEVLSIPGYPGQSRVVPPGVESHGSRGTKYPGIPRTVPGSPTRRGVPWIPRY